MKMRSLIACGLSVLLFAGAMVGMTACSGEAADVAGSNEAAATVSEPSVPTEDGTEYEEPEDTAISQAEPETASPDAEAVEAESPDSESDAVDQSGEAEEAEVEWDMPDSF